MTPQGILAAALESLAGRLEETGADAELRSELERARELAAGLDPYLAACTTPESPALAALRERTQAEDWGGRTGPLEQEMLSGHVEGQALKLIVHMTRATRVLELGMFTGYSALAMAEALPPGGTVVACEVDPEVAAFAAECFGASSSGEKIAVEVGPALATLERLAAADQTFDVVFVDADKPGYRAYVERILEGGLLAPHGVICVDNTLLQGEPYLPGEPSPNGRAIAEFNAALAADPRVEQVLIPLRDGLTLIRRV